MIINTQKSFFGQRGFIALITVLIITAVSIIIGTTIVLKSISHSSMSLSELYSAQAWASGNGCVEYVLGQYSIASTSWDFSTTTGYKGNETRIIGGYTLLHKYHYFDRYKLSPNKCLQHSFWFCA